MKRNYVLEDMDEDEIKSKFGLSDKDFSELKKEWEDDSDEVKFLKYNPEDEDEYAEDDYGRRLDSDCVIRAISIIENRKNTEVIIDRFRDIMAESGDFDPDEDDDLEEFEKEDEARNSAYDEIYKNGIDMEYTFKYLEQNDYEKVYFGEAISVDEVISRFGCDNLLLFIDIEDVEFRHATTLQKMAGFCCVADSWDCREFYEHRPITRMQVRGVYKKL